MPIQPFGMVVLHLSTRASQRNWYQSFWHLALPVSRTSRKIIVFVTGVVFL